MPEIPDSVSPPTNGCGGSYREKYCIPSLPSGSQPNLLYFLVDWLRFDDIREVYDPSQSGSSVWIHNDKDKSWVKSEYGLTDTDLDPLEDSQANRSTPTSSETVYGDIERAILAEIQATLKGYIW